VPAPPYYSIQLDSAPSRAQALARLKPYADELNIRAEQRKSGWQIRVGAWKERRQAEQALEAFHARGVKQARILSMGTSVPWLLPDGSTLVLAKAKPVAPAPATAVAAVERRAPAPAAAPVPAPVFIPPPPPPAKAPATVEFSERYRNTAQRYDTEVRRILRQSGVARRDGFTYGMDIAPLLLYAAERGDQTLYLLLLPAARKLAVSPAEDAFGQGFGLWRQRDGVKPELSGATETAWLARALWAGGEAFARSEDRALAQKVLEGWVRHTFELQNVWFARKYFDFAGRIFVNLSVVTSYQPDFMAAAERTVPDGAWRGLAERSYALLQRAVSPSKLLYPLIQPEVGATYPKLGLDVYGPNALAAMEDSCLAAESALAGAPKIAEGVLDFARGRGRRNAFGRIYSYFNGLDGSPIGDIGLSGVGYACLGELAAALGQNRAWKELEPQLILDMDPPPTVRLSENAPLYQAGAVLRTALKAGAFSAP
jgi:hypothetical protein